MQYRWTWIDRDKLKTYWSECIKEESMRSVLIGDIHSDKRVATICAYIWIFCQLPTCHTFVTWNKWKRLINLMEREPSKFPLRLTESPWPIADYTCVTMLDTSSWALHKCKLYITVRFQRVTPWAVIAHTNACVNDESLQRGPRRPRRCPHLHGER